MKKGTGPEPEFRVGDVLEPVEYTSESGEDPQLELERATAELERARLEKEELERRNKILLVGASVLLAFLVLVLAALWVQVPR